MNIIIPVNSDIRRLPRHIECLKHWGGLENHHLTYVPAFSLKQEVEDAIEPLKAICGNVSVKPLPDDPLGDKVRQCNYMFFHGAKIAMEMRLPWLWMELDAFPIKRHWADKLAMIYGSAGTPLVGHLAHFEVRDPITGKLNRPFGDSDKFMLGVGMYPADYYDKARGLMMDFSKGDNSARAPFDTYLRAALGPGSMSHTDFIDDQWNTSNFRIAQEGKDGHTETWNGALLCTPNDIKEGWPTRRGKVHPDAVLCHGCKDDSLARIILGLEPEAPAEPQLIVNTISPEKKPESPPMDWELPKPQYVTKSELSDMKKEIVSDLASLMRDFMKQKPIDQPTAAIVPPALDEPPGIWPVINRKLAAKKWRLTNLADAVKLPESELEELLRSKGYTFKTGLKWVTEPETATV